MKFYGLLIAVVFLTRTTEAMDYGTDTVVAQCSKHGGYEHEAEVVADLLKRHGIETVVSYYGEEYDHGSVSRGIQMDREKAVGWVVHVSQTQGKQARDLVEAAIKDGLKVHLLNEKDARNQPWP